MHHVGLRLVLSNSYALTYQCLSLKILGLTMDLKQIS